MNSTGKNVFSFFQTGRGWCLLEKGLSLSNSLHFLLFCSRLLLPCLNASLVLLLFLYTPQLRYAKELFKLYSAVLCILWRMLIDNRSILPLPCVSIRSWYRLQWQGYRLQPTAVHIWMVFKALLILSQSLHLCGWTQLIQQWQSRTFRHQIPKVRSLTWYSANFIHPHYQNIQHRRHVKEWIYKVVQIWPGLICV